MEYWICYLLEEICVMQSIAQQKDFIAVSTVNLLQPGHHDDTTGIACHLGTESTDDWWIPKTKGQ